MNSSASTIDGREPGPARDEDNSARMDFHDRISTYWPLLVIALIFGGLAGLLFAIANPPRYRATAAIAVSIDYGITTPLELVVEDRALDRAWQLILSDETLLLSIERLRRDQGSNTAWANLSELRRRIGLDQRLSRWELHATDEDPQVAAYIANAWAQTVLERMQDAQEHAWLATKMQGIPFLVHCMSLMPPASSQEALWQCVATSPSLNERNVAELRAEIEASHGILPNLSYEHVQAAIAPEDPVLWGRGTLVVAGSMLGLILALSSLRIADRRVLTKGQSRN